MQKSKIEWTDTVWNPVSGCNKISEGCKNCYAENFVKRFWKERKFTDVICHIPKLNEPKKWKKPKRIFVNSMSDLFHEKVPDGFIMSVLSIVEQCPQHTFFVLTKRADRLKRFFDANHYDFNKLQNLWCGVSVENNEVEDRITNLIQTTCKNKFISFEPLLEFYNHLSVINYVDWVIIGAESGSQRRYLSTNDILRIVNYCKKNNVPVFVKQIHLSTGKGFRLIKNIDEFPQDLQIRELPKLCNLN